MKTAVVILNWNTAGYLKRWLPGLLASCDGLDAGVIVADNASMDGSLELLRSGFPQVRVIELDYNYGFTGGYNRALGSVDAEYFVLLNSDVDVPEGWLQPLVDWMDSHPECAVCGPKLHALSPNYSRTDEFEYAGAAGGFMDRFGYPYCRGRVLSRTEDDLGQYDEPRPVQWVSGACLMVRASVWNQLGGLDDRFFAHMEEIDFCWRARLAGYTVEVVPASTVWHLGGGTLSQDSPVKLKLNYRNNLLMLDKNLPACSGPFRTRLVIFTRMVLDGFSALVYLVTSRPECFRAVVEAHREYRAKRGQAVPSVASDRPDRTGYGSKIMILPLAFLLGGRIFKYLKRYEDSHCGSR